MAVAHIFDCIIVLVIGVGLVNGVIGEVDEEVVDVFAVGQFVAFGGETDEALVVEVES